MRLPIVNVSRCPDRGLDALYILNDMKLDIYAWMVVFNPLRHEASLVLNGPATKDPHIRCILVL